MNDVDKELLWPFFVAFFSRKMAGLDGGKSDFLGDLPVGFDGLAEEEVVGFAKESALIGAYDLVRHVELVAYLRLTKSISVSDSMQLLGKVQLEGSKSKIKELSRVFDVLWLVREDLKDSFMEPDEDCLLDKALQQYLCR